MDKTEAMGAALHQQRMAEERETCTLEEAPAELLPCPFCDGRTELQKNSAVSGGLIAVHYGKGQCPLNRKYIHPTSWNTRTTRTSPDSIHASPDNMDGPGADHAGLVERVKMAIFRNDPSYGTQSAGEFADASPMRGAELSWFNERQLAELESLAEAVVKDAALSNPSPLLAEMEEALRDACDLLAERRYGSSARSPGHNARLVIEAALVKLEQAGAQK